MLVSRMLYGPAWHLIWMLVFNDAYGRLTNTVPYYYVESPFRVRCVFYLGRSILRQALGGILQFWGPCLSGPWFKSYVRHISTVYHYKRMTWYPFCLSIMQCTRNFGLTRIDYIHANPFCMSFSTYRTVDMDVLSNLWSKTILSISFLLRSSVSEYDIFMRSL